MLAPMSVGYGDEQGLVTDATVGHYARRAEGGAGAVITENIAISAAGRQLPRQLLASGDRFLPGLTALAAEIKRRGAAAIAQIVHSGRYAGPWDEYEVRPRFAPSAVSFELRPGQVVTPTAMSEGEINEAIDEFGVATEICREAGFDGVEIHGAQGFLVSSFQSPRMNRREDAFGADRDLFARLVLERVIAAAGERMIVGYHLMSDEMMIDGRTVDEAVEFVATLPARVDFLVPIATTFESLRVKTAAADMEATRYSPEVARRLAGATEIPIVGNGGLGFEAEAEAALASGDVAAVAVGRPLLSDPDLPRKILRGEGSSVRRCACSPPRCLQTQLSGSICSAWPEEVQRDGHWVFGMAGFRPATSDMRRKREQGCEPDRSRIAGSVPAARRDVRSGRLRSARRIRSPASDSAGSANERK